MKKFGFFFAWLVTTFFLVIVVNFLNKNEINDNTDIKTNYSIKNEIKSDYYCDFCDSLIYNKFYTLSDDYQSVKKYKPNKYEPLFCCEECYIQWQNKLDEKYAAYKMNNPDEFDVHIDTLNIDNDTNCYHNHSRHYNDYNNYHNHTNNGPSGIKSAMRHHNAMVKRQAFRNHAVGKMYVYY